MSLIVVKPVTVTPAMLTDTDVPETDYPEWAAGTTYAAGNRVISSSTHKIYQSLQAANTGNTPATAPLWWVEVSPTNRWKAFDLSNSTQTAQATSMYFEITPGVAINAFAALNLVGVQSIRVRLTDPAFGLLYDKTTQLTSIPQESSWYAFFFGERTERVQHIALDLPSYPNAVLRVDLTGAAAMAVGVLLLGQQRTIGTRMGVRSGVRMGIRDYSRKETNEWGDVVLSQRAYAKTRSFQVLLDNAELDQTDALLASLRATPALWIASTRYTALTVYGFFSSFEILVSYANHSDCDIDIEGLT